MSAISFCFYYYSPIFSPLSGAELAPRLAQPQPPAPLALAASSAMALPSAPVVVVTIAAIAELLLATVLTTPALY